MALPRPSSPRALIADIRAFAATRGQHRVIAAVLAVLIPALIFTFFFLQDSNRVPVQVVRVHMWPSDRTDAQIKADQKKAQAEKDARAKERQRQFQKLAEQLGIDD